MTKDPYHKIGDMLTRFFAQNSGDKPFLEFIYDRLLNVHREDEHVDHMITLKKFVDCWDQFRQRCFDMGVVAEREISRKLREENQHLRNVVDMASRSTEELEAQKMDLEDRLAARDMQVAGYRLIIDAVAMNAGAKYTQEQEDKMVPRL